MPTYFSTGALTKIVSFRGKHSKHLLLAGLLLGSSLSAQTTRAHAGPMDALLQDPDTARQFDYCQWRFSDGGQQEQLPDFELLLDTEKTTLPPRSEAAHVLADAGTKIALASKKKKQCRAIFEKGTSAFDAALAKAMRKIDRRGPGTPSDNPDHAEIQQRIKTLWREDQTARRVYIASRTEDKEGPKFWERRLAVAHVIEADANSVEYIRTVLKEIDWVDTHRFGEDISANAWILVQHADDHVELQAEVLGRMGKHLDNGGVRKGDYAYLWDRVAVNQGRLQRYGTQPDWECKPEGLTLMPLEDAKNVDARRAEMGLGPVQHSLDEMTNSVCG